MIMKRKKGEMTPVDWWQDRWRMCNNEWTLITLLGGPNGYMHGHVHFWLHWPLHILTGLLL